MAFGQEEHGERASYISTSLTHRERERADGSPCPNPVVTKQQDRHIGDLLTPNRTPKAPSAPDNLYNLLLVSLSVSHSNSNLTSRTFSTPPPQAPRSQSQHPRTRAHLTRGAKKASCSCAAPRRASMGNALAGRRRAAKVMTVDGATFRYKTPAAAGAALRGHPGHQLLESEEVRRLGVRARPLDRDAPLKPGKLYFLVQIPRGAAGAGAAVGDDDPRAPRKTWSGALHVGARERLESLMLSRRTVSDVSSIVPSSAARLAAAAGDAASPKNSKPPSSVEVGADGAVRLRMRLPKAEVARLMKESRDPTEAAERIMQLCVARDQGAAAAPPPRSALSGRNATTTAAAGLKREVSPAPPCLLAVAGRPAACASATLALPPVISLSAIKFPPFVCYAASSIDPFP